MTGTGMTAPRSQVLAGAGTDPVSPAAGQATARPMLGPLRTLARPTPGRPLRTAPMAPGLKPSRRPAAAAPGPGRAAAVARARMAPATKPQVRTVLVRAPRQGQPTVS